MYLNYYTILHIASRVGVKYNGSITILQGDFFCILDQLQLLVQSVIELRLQWQDESIISHIQPIEMLHCMLPISLKQCG